MRRKEVKSLIFIMLILIIKQSGILPTFVNRLVRKSGTDVQSCYNSIDVILIYFEIKK